MAMLQAGHGFYVFLVTEGLWACQNGMGCIRNNSCLLLKLQKHICILNCSFSSENILGLIKRHQDAFNQTIFYLLYVKCSRNT
jgi:hypothetical protein